MPANPLLTEPLYLAQYIERMGTGTRDMIRRCREAELAEPVFAVEDGFVTTIWRKTGAESQPESMEQRVLVLLINGPMSKAGARKPLRLGQALPAQADREECRAERRTEA